MTYLVTTMCYVRKGVRIYIKYDLIWFRKLDENLTLH